MSKIETSRESLCDHNIFSLSLTMDRCRLYVAQGYAMVHISDQRNFDQFESIMALLNKLDQELSEAEGVIRALNVQTA